MPKKIYKTGTKKFYIDKDGYKHDRKNTDRLNSEYKKRTYTSVNIRIRKDDTEVLDKLASVKSKNAYILDLIRKDIADE